MRYAQLSFAMMLSACDGTAWNTTVANDGDVRWAMISSVTPGRTTEKAFTARWGNPTQRIHEGAETRFVYRDMSNPRGYLAPHFGRSDAYVVVVFQYGIATGVYSSDTEGCRATFPPRPPGPGFYNPTTVRPVNCPPRARQGIDDDNGQLADAGSGKL